MITEEMQEILDLQQKLNEKIERLMPLNNSSSRIKEIHKKANEFMESDESFTFTSDYVYRELKQINSDKLEEFLDDNFFYTRNEILSKIFKEGINVPIAGDLFYIDNNEGLESILTSEEFSIFDESANPLPNSEIRRLINSFEDEDLPF